MYAKKINWAWVGGFFEGEGHIYWQEGRKGTKQAMCGRLILGQKDKRPLAAIYEFYLLQNCSKPQFYLRPASKKCERSRAIWILAVTRRDDVIRILEAIIPYLFQKRDKAVSVLKRLLKARKERDSTLATAMKLKQAGQSWREISRNLHISRVAIMSFARSKGVDLSRQHGFTDEVEWRKDRIARGLCSTCGKPRGAKGTTWKCRRCADKYNKWRKEHRRLYGRSDRK